MQTSARKPSLANVAMSLARELKEAFTPSRHHPLSQILTSAMSQFICDLGYHYINLIAHRAALRPFQYTGNDAYGQQTADHFQGQEIKKSMKRCAENYLGFIKGLRVEDVNGFWPPWAQPAVSTLGFTLLNMTVASTSYDEALEWLDVIQRTRRELRPKSKSLPVLSLGLLRIDSIFWRGPDNVLHLPPHVSQAFAASDNSP